MTDLPETLKRIREPRVFPVLGEQAFVPWHMVMEHEAQAQDNHGGQTVAGLADRGGLSWCELCAVLENRRYQAMDQKQAVARVFAHTIRWLSNSAILDELERVTGARDEYVEALAILANRFGAAFGTTQETVASCVRGVTSLERELAQAKAQVRTPGTVEVCERCDLRLADGWECGSALIGGPAECHLKRAPAAKEAE